MLLGTDLSQWNKWTNDFGQYQIHKATEGATYIDPTLWEWADGRIGTKCNGVYHYLSTKPPIQQARHFVQTVQALPLKELLICYDYEGDALAADPSGGLLKDMILATWELMHHQPVVYTNKSALTGFLKSPHWEWLSKNVSWWLADYETRTFNPTYKGVPLLMRQITSKPIWDIDIFFGSEGGWLDIARATKVIAADTLDILII